MPANIEAADVEAFMFDLDGTLLDFEGASHVALNAVMERALGAPTRDEWITWSLHAEILGTKEEDWSRKVLEDLGVGPDRMTPADLARRWQSEMLGAFPSMTLMPGVRDVLAAVRRRHPRPKLAIVTSSTRLNFSLKMASHPEIVDVMDVVVTGDEVKRGKPSPDIYLEAASRLGVDPRRCVVVEDAPSGVASGKAAGCFVVGVPDPRFAPFASQAFGVADVVVPSLAGLDTARLRLEKEGA